MLCQRCQSMVLREEAGSPEASGMLMHTFSHVLHETRASFHASILLGCSFCRLIEASPIWHSDYYWEEPREDIELRLEIYRSGSRSEPFTWEAAELLDLEFRNPEGRCGVETIQHVPDDFVDAQQQHARSSLDPGTSRNWIPFNSRLARMWMDACSQQHTSCRLVGASESLPLRLIDLAGAPTLVNTRDAGFLAAPYAALSYCWGQQGARFLTLKVNIGTHRRGIPVDLLPATFKDAIHVAQSLEYRYLWIDALCIVQDDEEEMRDEIVRMGDIYRHADLTIAAHAAASVHDGLFQHHNPFVMPLKFRLALLTKGATQPIERELTFTADRRDSKRPDSHLNRRGWVLQESILSHRVLGFEGEITWHCLQDQARESNPVPCPLERVKMSTNNMLQKWVHARSLPARTPADGPSSDDFLLFDKWYATMENYTQRGLAFPTDRLRALAGMARLIAQNSGATYLAGLWKEDLFRGLTWYVKGPHVSNNDLRGRVPSWSWASTMGGTVEFAHNVLYFSGQDPWKLFYAPCTALVDAFCTSEDPITMPTPPAPGRARSWGLTFQTALKPAVVRCEPPAADTGPMEIEGAGLLIEIMDRSRRATVTRPGADDSSWGLATLSYPLDDESVRGESGAPRLGADGSVSVDVFCLPLQHTTHLETQLPHLMISLVLVCHDREAGLYSRIGLAFVPVEWWSGDEEQVLCEII